MQYLSWISLAVVLFCGAALGAGLLMLWQQRGAKQALNLPHKWPLRSRVMLTAEEAQAFDWLRSIFPDHFVMCKLPVLRFTVPIKREQKSLARRWQELLQGVYCTFAVCTKEGTVIGCVDVHGRRGLSSISRELKERLLEDCAVTYITVRANALPNAGVVRAAFLGEVKEKSAVAEATRGGDTNFNTDMVTFSDEKRQAAMKELNKKFPPMSDEAEIFNPDGTGAFATLRPGRDKLKFDDSFVGSIDSHRGRLS